MLELATPSGGVLLETCPLGLRIDWGKRVCNCPSKAAIVQWEQGAGSGARRRAREIVEAKRKREHEDRLLGLPRECHAKARAADVVAETMDPTRLPRRGPVKLLLALGLPAHLGRQSAFTEAGHAWGEFRDGVANENSLTARRTRVNPISGGPGKDSISCPF